MSATKQPVWKLAANLGDVNPLEYGGYFIFTDETGVYPPEAEVLEVWPHLEASPAPYTVHRFILEPCTYINGVLSDNPYHPAHPVWFADSIPEIARSVGATPAEFIAWFLSADVTERAMAWGEVGAYHGLANLDSYPLQLTRAEAMERLKQLGVRP